MTAYYVFQTGDRRSFVTAHSENEAWDKINRHHSNMWVELEHVVPIPSENYFPDDGRILALYPLARNGDKAARNELQRIYDCGAFDPGFGRELDAFLNE